MTNTLPPDAARRLREAFARERRRLDQQIAMLSSERDSIIESADRANIDDEHDPEGSTIAYERSLTTSLLESARLTRSDLDRAAERLDRGVYGMCRTCGRAIAVDRLVVVPTTSMCVDCAES